MGFSGGPTNDFGYIAIALALLAGRRPSGVVVVALLYGALTTGAKNMVVVTGVPLALAPRHRRLRHHVRGGARADPVDLAVQGAEARRRAKEWSRHSDLNRGPAVYETAALPLSYVGAGRV